MPEQLSTPRVFESGQVPVSPEDFAVVRAARDVLGKQFTADQNGRLHHADTGKFASAAVVDDLAYAAQLPTYAETLNDTLNTMQYRNAQAALAQPASEAPIQEPNTASDSYAAKLRDPLRPLNVPKTQPAKPNITRSMSDKQMEAEEPRRLTSGERAELEAELAALRGGDLPDLKRDFNDSAARHEQKRRAAAEARRKEISDQISKDDRLVRVDQKADAKHANARSKKLGNVARRLAQHSQDEADETQAAAQEIERAISKDRRVKSGAETRQAEAAEREARVAARQDRLRRIEKEVERLRIHSPIEERNDINGLRAKAVTRVDEQIAVERAERGELPESISSPAVDRREAENEASRKATVLAVNEFYRQQGREAQRPRQDEEASRLSFEAALADAYPVTTPGGHGSVLTSEQQAAMARIEAARQASSKTDTILGFPATREPIQDTTRQGMGARLRKLMAQAADYIQQPLRYAGTGIAIQAGRAVGRGAEAREYFADQERGDRRRKIAGFVAGGVALVGAAVAVTMIARHGGSVDVQHGVVADPNATWDMPEMTVRAKGPNGGIDGALTGPDTGPEVQPPASVAGDTVVPHAVSEVLNVPQGKGFEDAIQQQYGLTDSQSREMYVHMEPALRGMQGTYEMAQGIGIVQAGALRLNEEAVRLAEEYLKSQGLA